MMLMCLICVPRQLLNAEVVSRSWLRVRSGADCPFTSSGRRPSAYWIHWQIEHIVAYFGTAAFLDLGFRTMRGRLATVSLLLEVIQRSIPGRHTQLIDWAPSSSGAILGVFAVALMSFVSPYSVRPLDRRPARNPRQHSPLGRRSQIPVPPFQSLHLGHQREVRSLDLELRLVHAEHALRHRNR
jgi:VanZ family protein